MHASVIAIVEDAKGEPLNVGRKTRSIPPALQRALSARDKGCCRFPDCTHKRYTDAHHIKHWAKGGKTKMSNLVTLWRFHHRKVHEGHVQIQVLDDGAVRFVQPNGECFDDGSRTTGDWQQLPVVHERAGIHVDARTAGPRGGGGSMYLRRQVSAET